MWLKKSECKFSLLVLVFPCSSVDLFFEKINRNLNKKTNSNDGKQSSSLLTVWLCLVYLGLASSALSCIRFFLAHRVTICSRFSGTAPIRNILSCCQTMCRTMCPDIFMENVVSFRRIFSVSLMGLSLTGVRRPLRLVWAVHLSYSVCENQLISLHLLRAQIAFSNHVQRPPISYYYSLLHST